MSTKRSRVDDDTSDVEVVETLCSSDPVWNHVEKQSSSTVKCKHCSAIISNKVERIRKHYYLFEANCCIKFRNGSQEEYIDCRSTKSFSKKNLPNFFTQVVAHLIKQKIYI